MKWIALIGLLLVIVFFGLTGWLAEPGSARALDQQSKITLNLQSSKSLAPSVTPSPTATLSPGEYPHGGPEGDIIFQWPLYIPFIRLDPSATPTNTPSPTPTPTRTPRPPHEFLVCTAPGQAIPDGSTSGLRSDITLNEDGLLLDLDVYVRISHTWVGDLSAELVERNVSPLLSTVLFNRPGLENNAPSALASSSLGCQFDNIQAIFDNRAEQLAENRCTDQHSLVNVAVGGTFNAHTGLDQFRGQPAAGVWSLLVGDNFSGNTGTLDKWCLHGWVGDTAPPIPTPTPSSLPTSAFVNGVTGLPQTLHLSCESRSAVDWAKFFGVTIGELDFFYQLPSSDNPDEGFVGNVNGAWGQIPPNDYGVHAWPVATLLRSYGLTANGNRGLKYDDLRSEIARGHPVIVWIVGNVQRSAPEYYRAQSDGHISIVAKYEHTVIVYGYDEQNVYFQNGGNKSQVPIALFLDSWSALGNMAIMAQP